MEDDTMYIETFQLFNLYGLNGANANFRTLRQSIPEKLGKGYSYSCCSYQRKTKSTPSFDMAWSLTIKVT